MNRGLYTSASAMVTNLMRQETVVHNLSNVQTVGYKTDRTAVIDFPSLVLARIYDGETGPEVGRVGTGVELDRLVTDFDDGPMQLTENDLDFATVGDGYFRLQTPDGLRYTRDGRFHRAADGRLVNTDGYPVLGVDGQINLPDGLPTVSTRGEIYVNNVMVGRISLARFTDTENLVKQDQTTFSSRGPDPEEVPIGEAKVYQGYIERSNVDVSQTVTEMLTVLRAYQSSQRLVQFQDQINAQAVSQLGSV